MFTYIPVGSIILAKTNNIAYLVVGNVSISSTDPIIEVQSIQIPEYRFNLFVYNMSNLHWEVIA